MRSLMHYTRPMGDVELQECLVQARDVLDMAIANPNRVQDFTHESSGDGDTITLFVRNLGLTEESNG